MACLMCCCHALDNDSTMSTNRYLIVEVCPFSIAVENFCAKYPPPSARRFFTLINYFYGRSVLSTREPDMVKLMVS